MPTIVIGGTTFNTVTVSGTFFDTNSGGYATGALQFQMTDLLWAVPLRACGATAPLGATLNGVGAFTINLLSHDNLNINTDWFWQVSGTIAGLAIPARKFKLYFSLGATQDISAILAGSAVIT
jgi:hypothetical protein